MRVFRRLFLLGAVAFLLIQLLPSGRSNPPVVPDQTIERTLTVPADVSAILDRSVPRLSQQRDRVALVRPRGAGVVVPRHGREPRRRRVE
jgi:hypothetical protein